MTEVLSVCFKGLYCQSLSAPRLDGQLFARPIIDRSKKLSAAINFKRLVFIRDHSKFAGAAVGAVINLIVDDDARPGAGSRGGTDHGFIALRRTKILFPAGKTIRVVLETDGHLKFFFQLFLNGEMIELGDVGNAVHGARVEVDEGRDGKANALHFGTPQARDERDNVGKYLLLTAALSHGH